RRSSDLGIVNSLGERRCKEAVSAVAPLIADADAMVAEAALAALGKMGGADAVTALQAAKDSVAAGLKMVWADALLLCADQFVAEKQFEPAAVIYEAMYAPEQPVRVRIAAFRGLVAARGEAGIGLVVEALAGEDAALQAVATGLAREITGPGVTDALVAQLEKMSPVGQVRLLGALADRGDAAALPAVNRAVRHEDKDVRIAAIEAIAKLGDASSVEILLKVAVSTEGTERRAARNSLYAVKGSGVDDAITGQIQSGGEKTQLEAVPAAVERNILAAVPVLIDLTKSAQMTEEVRTEAFKALAALATPDNLPLMVPRMMAAQGESERAEAVKAVVTTAKKIPDQNQRAEVLLATWPQVQEPAAKAILLTAMGELGDDNSIEVVRAAAQDADAQIKEAASRALSQWPTPAVLDDLLAMAKSSDNDTLRVLALRGYVRLLAVPSVRPMTDTIERYREALTLAKRPEEQKAVLAGLGNIKSPDALNLLGSFLADESLKSEAAAAALKIAQNTCGAAPEAVKAVLAKLADIEATKKPAHELSQTMDKFGDFIVAWQVSGPYRQEGKNAETLFDIAFPPENANAEGVVWEIMPAAVNQDQPFIMNLAQVLGGDNAAAYLRTNLIAPTAQEAVLKLGSNDGVKVWLNGEVVHGNNVGRGCAPDSDTVTVKLNAGANPLVLKVTQSGGDWAACARVQKPDGSAIDGLKAEVK
ncbi:MAG: hypothetical protein QG656_1113, partial [Candidatus Hydrogenedentes bacterium]|nr:hypothetical protein [Candidatus Hydrogenedentota bacterium]